MVGHRLQRWTSINPALNLSSIRFFQRTHQSCDPEHVLSQIDSDKIFLLGGFVDVYV